MSTTSVVSTTSSGLVVSSGSEVDILDQGIAIHTTVLNGGLQVVSSGGVASATVVNSGTEIVYGTASGTVVSYGGQTVLSGGTALGTTVDLGASLQVQSGGTVSGATLNFGGALQLIGGIASGTTASNGSIAIFSGAVTTGSILSSGGNESISAGGQAIGTTVSRGGYQYVYSGGTTTGTVISASGLELLYSGGAASGTIVSGGFETVQAGASAFGTIVRSGGAESLYGLASGTTVLSGGKESINSGGTASASVISAGGSEIVSAGGSAVSGTILGAAIVSNGGTTIGATVSAGGAEIVSSGGIARGTTVSNGGVELVYSGGTASGTIVASGGALVVLPGGGQTATVQAGGAIVSTGIVVNHANASVSLYGSTATGLVIGAGETEYVLSGGSASATTLSGTGATSAGGEIVYSGGVASGTAINRYGVETVSAGGVALDAAVNSFGNQNVYGTASHTTVNSRGVQTVYAGGTASATTVKLAAVELVSSGGTAVGAVINSGGSQTIYSGGVASGTLVNSGGVLVASGGTVAGRLSLDAGAVLSGTVSGGGATLELTSTGVAGALSGLGTRLVGFTSITLDSGAAWGMTGANALGSGTTLTNGGSLTLLGATFNDAGAVVNNGTIELDPSTLTAASLTGSGTVQIDSGSTLTVSGAVGGGETIVFAGTAASLALGDPASFAGTISGFDANDTIDLTGVGYDGGGKADFNTATDVLTITENGNSYTLHFAGDYTGQYFHLASDGTTGTVVTEDGTPCYCRGTLILTGRGEVAVEDLRIGDRLVTVSGAARPIRWIGRRSYSGRMVAANRDIQPVMVRAGALADGVPRRDLLVSPLHALYLDGVLIPAVALLNGISIRQIDTVEQVEYFHLELDSHDVILAEGAPAESFVDDDSRGMFHNAAEYRILYPDAAPAPARYCAPRVEDGEELEAVRRRLLARVLPATPEAPAAPLAPSPVPAKIATRRSGPPRWRGFVDRASRDVIAGWAVDESCPDEPVALEILDNGVPIARIVANRHRADLASVGIGNGRHAFEVRIPGGLSPLARHVVVVRREADGGELENSPAVIEAATGFDPALEQAVANAVAGLGAAGEQERVLSFLVAQTDRLLQQRAELEGRPDARLAHRQFRRRWAPVAGTDAEIFYPGAVDPGRRALVIDDIAPKPDRDAGSQAILSHMRALQSLGYEVSFAAAMDMAADDAAIAALEASGIACWRAPFYAAIEDLLRRQAQCFDVVYLHRAPNAAKYLALARQYCPKARILYSVADLHHVRLARQAAIEQRPELMAESRRLRLIECTAAWAADAVITHSRDEAALLRQAVPDAKVHVVPWHVPRRPEAVPFARRHGVAFIGGYDHAPNVDAARFLAEEVMPLVWRSKARLECLLVGSRMPDGIKRLARRGLVPLGHVADLAEVFDRVRLTVAPLRYGAGVKGKVLDSLAAGVPCVMSPIAAEGIALPPTLQDLIGQDAAQLASRILQLHSDAAENRAAAEAGLALIGEGFAAAAIASGLQAAIEGRDMLPMRTGMAARG